MELIGALQRVTRNSITTAAVATAAAAAAAANVANVTIEFERDTIKTAS